jgi:hypothetical protein
MKCALVAGISSPKAIKLHLIIRKVFLVHTLAIASPRRNEQLSRRDGDKLIWADSQDMRSRLLLNKKGAIAFIVAQ